MEVIRINDKIFQMPTVRHLVTSVTDDLAQERSVLLLTPDYIEPEFLWYEIHNQLISRDCQVTIIDSPNSRSKYDSTSKIVSSHLGWDDDGCYTAGDLLDATLSRVSDSISPVDVIHVKNTGSNRMDSEWISFMSEWAQICQDSPHSITFCFIVPAKNIMSYPTKQEVKFVIHHWWQIPFPSEVRVICQKELLAYERGPEALWKGYLVPSLASNDVRFAEFIWDDVCLYTKKIEQKIVDFAAHRSWSVDYIQKLNNEELSQTDLNNSPETLTPNTALWDLWAAGVLVYSPEYGIERHISALIAMGRKEELAHRLWRAQTPLLLPFIDRLRLQICQRLTEIHGPEWIKFKDWHSSYKGRYFKNPENPLACELHDLKIVVEDCMPQQKHLLPCIRQMSKMRNHLAHYSPVEYDDFYTLWGDAKEMGFSL